MQRRLDEPTKPAKKPEPVMEEKSPEIAQYISTSVLRDFSITVGEILQQWHFPGATDVYFDEKTKDVVIGGDREEAAAPDYAPSHIPLSL